LNRDALSKRTSENENEKEYEKELLGIIEDNSIRGFM